MADITLYKIRDNHAVPYNGTYPFINWMDGPLSTDLYYTQTLFIETPSPLVKLTFPEDSIFKFFKPNGESVSSELKDSLHTEITLTNNYDAIKLDQTYLYHFTLVTKSPEAGEIMDVASISTVGDDESLVSEKLAFAAEFYGANEPLYINAANRGIEFPQSITQAIYDGDPREKNTDWILLNRKMREILIEFMNTVGIKGSYKSLLNSLRWFDYGELVQIKEVWEHKNRYSSKYFEHDITSLMTDELRSRLHILSKTTYFLLKHTAQQFRYKDDGTLEYEDDVPLLVDLYDVGGHPNNNLVKWDLDDMRLKIMLLGEYFETYFMPVHLNLIYSIVENLYFGKLGNLMTGSVTESLNIHDELKSCSAKYAVVVDGQSNIDEKTYQTSDLITIDDAYIDVVDNVLTLTTDYFGITGTPTNAFKRLLVYDQPVQENHDIILGVNRDVNKTIGNDEPFNMYSGLGALIDFEFSFDEEVKEGYVITDVNTTNPTPTCRWSGTIGGENGEKTILFRMLIQTPGEHFMIFKFASTNSTYFKMMRLNIKEDVTPYIDFYKVIRKKETPNTVQFYQGTSKTYMDALAIENTDNFQLNMFSREQLPPLPDGYFERTGNTYNVSSLGLLNRLRKFEQVLYMVEDMVPKITTQVFYDNQPRLDPVITFYADKERPDKTLSSLARRSITNTLLNSNGRNMGANINPADSNTASDLKARKLKIQQAFYIDYISKLDAPTSAQFNEDYFEAIRFIRKNVYSKTKYDAAYAEIVALKTNLDQTDPHYITNKYVSVVEKKAFIPDNHELKYVGIDEEVQIQYPVAIVPYLEVRTPNNPNPKKLLISKATSGPIKWTITSYKTMQPVLLLDENVTEPFLASTMHTKLPLGHYRVELKYNWGGQDKTIISASPKFIGTAPIKPSRPDYYTPELL